MDQIEQTIERRRGNSPAGLAWAANVLGLLLLAVSVNAQAVPTVEAKTVGTEKAASMAQIKKAPNAAATEDQAIRPFRVNIPEEALADLRRRIAATRFPDKETVTDRSQGVRLAKFQELIRYWGTDYNWRKAEAKLNALPQFVTNIDGLDIHFIQVRSKEPNALPIIVTHGWPGSVIEQLKIIDPLTNPTAYGGKVEDAFDVVIPSIPGFGFSGKPTGTGWDPDRIARAWSELMMRLGYTRYVAQGGDWGSPISSSMARQAVPGLLGIHINLPATVPSEIAAALATGGSPPTGLSEKERAAFESLDTFFKKYRAYGVMMGTRPQTIGYALTDSPAGLAAWIYDYNNGEPERLLNRDDVLDDITLYWLTNSATSAARIYWETSGRSVTIAAAQKTTEISLPVAITVFPGEVYRSPETWARRAYRNLIYFREAEKGGHFASWEQPQLFAEEMRAAFRFLRSDAAPAQLSGIRRTDLLRNDLSVPGREVLQVRVDFDPGAVAAKHNHPGEEIVHVLEGSLEYEVEGKPAVTLKAGDVLFIPAGAAHRVRNVGRGNGSELATYIVEKGKPLITLVK
ncbi:MAG TPA: alpha/beta fold hydrolase [Pyrinomonadaceae bacterium]|jgi:quercetin dioxygenase-like cupin family protein/pimeloyl-ACP methyl ester carboxylesterase